MMLPIGGYFEWEFPTKSATILHADAIRLNSARHALEYILQNFPYIRSLWVPFFTCEAILEPLKRLKVEYKFYHINDLLEIRDSLVLREGEFLLYTNYYGIKDAYISQLVGIYKEKLIVDNAQALYCNPIANHQFYSPRKFIGMPDGGLAITTARHQPIDLPTSQSFERCSHLLKRVDLNPDEGYPDFQKNDASLSNENLAQMSILSSKIYDSVDFERIQKTRLSNFQLLYEKLAESNRLQIPPTESFACPLVYPYWTNDDGLKKRLIDNKIYVATYWPNVFNWCNPNDLEYELANHIVCIPIDQRYGASEMNYILDEMIF